MEPQHRSRYGVTDDAWLAFRLRVKGEIITPGHDGYEGACEIHNARVERRPAFIVRVRDAADVSRTVTFARLHGIPLSVRAGGHGLTGRALVDDGAVIDMTLFKDLRIDPVSRTAWAQPGLTAGEYAEAVHEHGLATPFGDAGSVGLGGITLGGGIGYLARKYGLTIDNLLGVEMVTADGQIIQASATENEDLFWAVRGGGGNFGVVTGFHYRLVEAGTVYGGLLLLPATRGIIAEYARLALDADDELTTIGEVFTAPPEEFIPEDVQGTPVFGIFVVFVGGEEEGTRAMAPFRALAEPIADLVGPMPYPAIYEYAREAEARRREKLRSGFYDELDERLIEEVLARAPDAPSPMGFFQVRPLGGEMARVPVEATAFSNRQANFLVAIIDMWDDRADDDANIGWVERAWESIKSTRHGAYSNFLQDDADERLGEAYRRETLRRLAEIKVRYDPDSFFHGNVSIPLDQTKAA
jgi:FAD/FMN-containing dehydrogenase